MDHLARHCGAWCDTFGYHSKEMELVHALVAFQLRLSGAVDRLLPERLQVDGNRDFLDRLIWNYVRPGMAVWDLGGGKCPCFSAERKAELRLHVTGLDLSEEELVSAPAGSYDEVVVADITKPMDVQNAADLVICQSIMEHVPDNQAAITAVARILRPGGIALIFVPCRKAWYARLNLSLPDTVRKKLVQLLYGDRAEFNGFQPFYDRCTPAEFTAMALESGLQVVEQNSYYQSTYFRVAFPAYVAWRSWMLARMAFGVPVPETFSLVLRKAN